MFDVSKNSLTTKKNKKSTIIYEPIEETIDEPNAIMSSLIDVEENNVSAASSVVGVRTGCPVCAAAHPAKNVCLL